MAWSAALGLAGSAIGAISANNRAEAQMEMKQRELDQQREFQEQQMALAADAQRRQQEENRYRRQIEQMNRRIAQQNRQYQLDVIAQQREDLIRERQRQIDRQLEADRAAARQRQFQIEQMLQNQDLAEEEREFAKAQLAEAQAIAAGERDEDKRRFLEERAMAEANRDFVMQEYAQAKRQADAERQRDLAIQNQIMAQAGALRDQLEGTAAQLGYVPEIPRLDQSQIDSEIRRRTQQYQSDVDRAADRVASVNEAELIRIGLDESTPGIARRGEVAERLAQEYQNARQRAYDDALGYITGRQDAMANNVGNIIDRRQAILGETGDIASSELGILQQLRNAQSAANVYDMASRVPTGIYDRDIASANDYRRPVPINSAIYDSVNPGTGLSNFNVTQSVANTSGLRVGDGITNATSQTLPSASNFYQNAMRTGNSILDQAASDARAARQDSIVASRGFGQDFQSFISDALEDTTNDIGFQIDSLFDTTGSYEPIGGGAPPSVRGIGKSGGFFSNLLGS